MGGIKLYALLFLAVIVSGLAALFPLAWFGTEALSSSYRENAVRETEGNARLFALAAPAAVGGKTGAELGGLVRAAREATGARYTLIAPDGVVLADSDEDADRMENHLHRPEVQAALAGRMGVEIRSSPTLGADWIYAATRLEDGSVVRAAASMEGLNQRQARWWRRALAAFAVSTAVLLVAALLVARQLAKPLEAAAAGAERYAAGDFSYRPPATGPREMRKLSAAMSVMAGELDSRFTLITRQREEMRAVFDTMSDGVIAVDADGRVMLMNGMAETILGVDNTATNASLASRIRNAPLQDLIRDTLASGESREQEIRVAGASGGESLVRAHTAHLRESSGGRGVLVVLRDVTRLRHLEIMRRDFVANVSHELRTPITAIQSCLETVLEDSPDDGGKHGPFLEMAARNARRMGAIIDNLLFLAGMESGSKEGSPETIALAPVAPAIDEATAQCRADAAGRNVTISVDCEDGLTALMNPQLVVHALVNLVDNAVKYGPEGGAVAVTARREGETVRISVSDSGPGIAPRHRSRIFERFYRVDGPARVKRGSGLGLSIVKHIAQSQGGGICLESEIGAGSTFTLTLPGGAG